MGVLVLLPACVHMWKKKKHVASISEKKLLRDQNHRTTLSVLALGNWLILIHVPTHGTININVSPEGKESMNVYTNF